MPCIYIIPFRDCNHQYIDHKRPFKIRIREHELAIKRPGTSAAADHQNSLCHKVDFSNVEVLHYEKSKSKRLILESLFIRDSETFVNNSISKSLLIF